MAAGISTMFLPELLTELCDRLKLQLPEEQAGNFSDTIKEENVAIASGLLEYACISAKQHRFLILNVSTKWKVWS